MRMDEKDVRVSQADKAERKVAGWVISWSEEENHGAEEAEREKGERSAMSARTGVRLGRREEMGVFSASVEGRDGRMMGDVMRGGVKDGVDRDATKNDVWIFFSPSFISAIENGEVRVVVGARDRWKREREETGVGLMRAPVEREVMRFPSRRSSSRLAWDLARAFCFLLSFRAAAFAVATALVSFRACLLLGLGFLA